MSTQHKLSQNRPPRVNITYDVENEGAQEKKELPFVLGVIGEFSKNVPQFHDRNFINVSKENIDLVMQGLDLSLVMNVENKLTDENVLLNVNLNIRSMSDFSPESIAQQVEPLRLLVEARGKLSDLKSRVLSNEKLREHLESIKEGEDTDNVSDKLNENVNEEDP